LGKLFHEGYAADSLYLLVFQELEKLAKWLPGTSFLVMADPWVSKNRFDGGAVQYVLVAAETGPMTWGPGEHWSLGAMYNRSYPPKAMRLFLPNGFGQIYDLFEQLPVRTEQFGSTVSLTADLTTFPGRLYALTRAEMATPHASAAVSGDTAELTVQVHDAR